VLLLFQTAMLANFWFTSFNLLGAYVLSYLFCLWWGRTWYLLLSDVVFCLVTVWFCDLGSLAIGLDLDFWYLLFTLVPSLLLVYLRNVLLMRFISPIR